jgi:amidase
VVPIPSAEEVREVAARLGLHLGPDEAVAYQGMVASGLEELDRFAQARLEEGAPAVTYPTRDRGARPSADDDPLNAWVWRCEITGAPSGLLAGTSVSFKDNVPVAGVPMSVGAFALEGLVPDIDATVVTRVLAAGGTIVGKNTMDGLGGLPAIGQAGDYGRPSNPHAPAHLTGGSSSGCAAAVAAGEVDVAFGGDQGGSIRIPAAWCGVVGLKATFGLVSQFGISHGAEPTLDHTGPMARTVDEVAAALQAVAGYDGLDFRQDRTVPDAIDALTDLDRGVAGLRIGLLEEGFAEPLGAGVRRVVDDAVAVLATAGAEVQRVSVPPHRTVMAACNAINTEGGRAVYDTGFYTAFARTYYPTNMTAAFERFYRYETDRLAPHLKARLLLAEFSRRNFHGMVYAKAHNVRPSYIRAYDDALDTVDVLLMPTCLVTAPEFGAAPSVDGPTIDVGGAVMRNTFPFNYTGHPALAMPCGKTDGLPVSFELVGRYYDDPLLLRVAHAFQQSVPWDDIVGIQGPGSDLPK